jgi:hypothetical protein
MEYHVWLSKKYTVQGNDIGHSRPHGVDTSPKSPYRGYFETEDDPDAAHSGFSRVVRHDENYGSAVSYNTMNVLTKQRNVVLRRDREAAEGTSTSDSQPQILIDGTDLDEEAVEEAFLNFDGQDYTKHPCPTTNETQDILRQGGVPALARRRHATPLGYVSSILSGYGKVCVHVLGVECEEGEQGCTIGGNDPCPGGNEEPPVGDPRTCFPCPSGNCASLKNRWIEVKAQAGFDESTEAQICVKPWTSNPSDETDADSSEACGNGFLDSCRDSGVELDEETGFVAGTDTTGDYSFRPSAKYMFFCKEDCDLRQTKFFWRILASELPNDYDYRRNSPYFGTKSLHYDGDYIEYENKFYSPTWMPASDSSTEPQNGYYKCSTEYTGTGPRFIKRKNHPNNVEVDPACEPFTEALWYKAGGKLHQIPPAKLINVNGDGTLQNDPATDSTWYLPVHQPDAENWCEHRSEVQDYPESLMDPYNRECQNNKGSPCNTFAAAEESAQSGAGHAAFAASALAASLLAALLL